MRAALPKQVVKPSQFPFADLLLDIQQEWDRAEAAIKRCDQVANGAIIPAINELRYAGRRIVDALNAGHKEESEASVRALLEDARFNCHRARHDAVDAALDVIGKDLDNLTHRLGYDPVTRAYPGFSELYADFARARAKIAESRGNRDNRNAIYETIELIDFPSLADRYADLVTCKPIALSFAAKAKRQQFSWWVMFVIAIGSLTFAGLNYKKSYNPETQLKIEQPKQH